VCVCVCVSVSVSVCAKLPQCRHLKLAKQDGEQLARLCGKTAPHILSISSYVSSSDGVRHTEDWYHPHAQPEPRERVKVAHDIDNLHTHARTHARTYTHTHTRTHAHTHAKHIHTQTFRICLTCAVLYLMYVSERLHTHICLTCAALHLITSDVCVTRCAVLHLITSDVCKRWLTYVHLAPTYMHLKTSDNILCI
jgi:hypothetical protein